MRFARVMCGLMAAAILAASVGCGPPQTVTKDPVQAAESIKKQAEMSQKERGR